MHLSNLENGLAVLDHSFGLHCRAEAQDVQLGAAEAARELCTQLPQLLTANQTAAVRQAALLALTATARAFGGSRPDLVLASLPALLPVTADGQRPVRSSALVALAACVAALRTRALAQLLPIASAVMTGLETATTGLSQQQQQHLQVRPFL